MNKYLTNLTPMRGIAALLTVIYHVDLMIGNGGDMLIKRKDSMVLSRMYLMVDFFLFWAALSCVMSTETSFLMKLTEAHSKNLQ